MYFIQFKFLLQTDLNSELKKEKNELRDKEAVSLYWYKETSEVVKPYNNNILL